MGNKVVVRIQWWLWNQMFQYAYAYALSKRNWSKFLLDVSTFERYKVRKNQLSDFDIIPPYADKKDIPFYERLDFFHKNRLLPRVIKSISWRLNPNDYRETSKWFDSKLAEIKKWYITWYFQSEKYFKDYEDGVRKIFAFSDKTKKKVKSFIADRHIDVDDFVAISVRRWDFWEEKNHYLIPIERYLWAYEKYFLGKKLIFFSDDINWCRENFDKLSQKYPKMEFVEGMSAVEWLSLMVRFKNFIISNSTFSWRWAYLSDYKKKIVVRPDLEFDRRVKWGDYCRDHYPEERIPFKW